MGLWPDSGNRARKIFNGISNHRKLMVGCKSDLFLKSRARRTHCVPCSVFSNHNIDNVFDQVTEILQFQEEQAISLRSPRFLQFLITNINILISIQLKKNYNIRSNTKKK